MESKYTHIYFLGIGGIGMSALAYYYHFNAYKVAGYDKFQSNNCIRLEKHGVEIHYSDEIRNIPEEYLNKETCLVVLTPAIPQDSEELNYFKDNNFKILKRSEILGLISNDKDTIAIAGTHGKTSVSTISSWIMSNGPESCNAFLGGISKNFNSNVLIKPDSRFAVVEADEFDRSFLTLSPSVAVITSIEADHLDIYNNFETLRDTFVDFAKKINTSGSLVLHKSIDKSLFVDKLDNVTIFKYGIDDVNCDFNLTNINYKNEACYFDIISPNGKIENIKYSIGGNHNLENALAAASTAILNDVPQEIIKSSLESFSGVIRRFDIGVKRDGFIYIDDYAHHPSEIKAFLNAVKTMYPNKEITAVFQPHLFTRTKDFYKEFGESLSACDNLFLLPIYPAREKPIEGINSELILENCTAENKAICEKGDLIKILKQSNPELLVTMGAGDIDQFVEPIKIEFKS